MSPVPLGYIRQELSPACIAVRRCLMDHEGRPVPRMDIARAVGLTIATVQSAVKTLTYIDVRLAEDDDGTSCTSRTTRDGRRPIPSRWIDWTGDPGHGAERWHDHSLSGRPL